MYTKASGLRTDDVIELPTGSITARDVAAIVEPGAIPYLSIVMYIEVCNERKTSTVGIWHNGWSLDRAYSL